MGGYSTLMVMVPQWYCIHLYIHPHHVSVLCPIMTCCHCSLALEDNCYVLRWPSHIIYLQLYNIRANISFTYDWAPMFVPLLTNKQFYFALLITLLFFQYQCRWNFASALLSK